MTLSDAEKSAARRQSILLKNPQNKIPCHAMVQTDNRATIYRQTKKVIKLIMYKSFFTSLLSDTIKSCYSLCPGEIKWYCWCLYFFANNCEYFCCSLFMCLNIFQWQCFILMCEWCCYNNWPGLLEVGDVFAYTEYESQCFGLSSFCLSVSDRNSNQSPRRTDHNMWSRVLNSKKLAPQEESCIINYII